MTGKFYSCDKVSRGAVQSRDSGLRSVSVANENLIRCRVITRIIGIARKPNSLQRLVRAPVEHSNGAIVAVGHENMIGFWCEGHALRFPQTENRINDFVRTEIEHFKSVVAQGAHKQSLTSHIDVEMIDAPMNIRQRDRLDQSKRRIFLRISDLSADCQHESEKNNSSDHVEDLIGAAGFRRPLGSSQIHLCVGYIQALKSI